jgi:hypothetical protein
MWRYIQEVPDKCSAIHRMYQYQLKVQLYTGSTRSMCSYIQGGSDQCGYIYRKYQINVQLYTGSTSTSSMCSYIQGIAVVDQCAGERGI